MTQQVVNGYNEVRRPNGDVALTDVFEHSITGKQNCIVDKTYYDVGDLLAKGRTFTPLVAMTPERIEALKFAANSLSIDIGSTTPDYTEDASTHVAILRAMIDELKGATDGTLQDS